MSWRVESKISSRYSISILWLNLNIQVEHLDLTQILELRILTWIESWWVENSTQSRWLDLTRSVYSIYIRFLWFILNLFIFTINKVIILSIACVTRYVKQILAIMWQSVWTCLFWKVKFSWSMRFLSLWISLLVDFILIMQVFVLRSFQRQDMFFSQICFQSSDKID